MTDNHRVDRRTLLGSGRSRAYPLAGALLALGAPLGLLIVRAATAGAWPAPRWIAAELAGDRATYLYLLLSTTTVFAVLGRVLGAKEDALEAISTRDALTGLANRRQFDARFEEELRRADRHGKGLALLLVDVDRLKKINDEGGHRAGDAALRAVGRALKAAVRRTDTAARVGGDEFAVLAPMTTAGNAVELGNRIRAALAEIVGAPTVSIGVADLALSSGRRAEDLTAAADRALYAAKDGGRDRVLVAEKR